MCLVVPGKSLNKKQLSSRPKRGAASVVEGLAFLTKAMQPALGT
jgi:hypothetical protein